jgi:hypothetical protein
MEQAGNFYKNAQLQLLRVTHSSLYKSILGCVNFSLTMISIQI